MSIVYARTTGVACLLTFGCCSAATAIGADESSVRHGSASQKTPAIDVEIVSVQPSGIRIHFQGWVAVGRVAATKGIQRRSVLLYLHSPVQTFGVPADEAVGRRFRAIVQQRRGEHIFKFEVDRDDDAK